MKILESRRNGEKISQELVCNVGTAKSFDELVALEKLAKEKIAEILNSRNPVLPGFEGEFYGQQRQERPSISISDIIEEKRINVGVQDVFGALYSQMDFEDIIVGTRKDSEWNEVLKQLIMARLLEPESKRYTAKEIFKEINCEIPLEKIYRLMDRVVVHEDAIKKKVFQSSLSLLDHEVDVLFFDVTTLYFESFEPDELRDFGFSKDCKFKETQVVLALVTNNRGVPLTYEIFPGNTNEGKTLIEIVRKLKAAYTIKNVVIVADRAMFSDENLCLLEAEEIKYIVAAKLRTMKKEITEKLLIKDVCSLEGWIKDIAYGNRRLVVSYAVDRAKRDFKQRKRLIDRLLKKANNGKIPLKALINNNGTKKYIEVNGEKASINEQKFISDSQWDGIHGVITNFTAEELSSSQTLEKYKGLWKIEEVFRVNKNDMKMRPIYHWKPRRIRAHILICFMSYVVLNTTKEMLSKYGLKISIRDLIRELSRRQNSIIRDKFTQRRYMVPSQFTETQRIIYKALNLPMTEAVQLIR